MSRELYYSCFLKDDQLRSSFGGAIESWMFSGVARSVADILLKMKTYSEAALRAELSAYVTDAELAYVTNVVNSIESPLHGDNFDSAAEKLTLFAQEKSFARVVHQATHEGFDSSIVEELATLGDVGAMRNRIWDFTDKGDISDAYDDMFPFGKDRVIQSSFSLINNSLMMGGYTPGTVNLFVARPGAGKTTMMLQEGLCALVQGFKVFHVMLGDMKPWDAVSKYVACRNMADLSDVVGDVWKYINPETHPSESELFSRLKCCVFSSYEVNIDGLSSLARRVHREWPYDMLIIDYDGNIRPVKEDSLYESGGYTYGRLEALCRQLPATLLVASQAKVSYWGEEVIPMESAADSSKKQHVVDMMVTLGKSSKVAPVGTINIAKMRRGESDVQSRVYVAGKYARIKEINDSEYRKVLAEYGHSNSTPTAKAG